MIPVADPFMADARPTGLQRGRGGFLRAANDTPYVTHPDGTLVNSGPRKGEPLRVAYGQFSSAGRLIENDVGLTKYKQRLTLLGIGMSNELVEQCRDLATMEAGNATYDNPTGWSDEFRKAADTIVVEADNLTRSWLAADRGSHGHLICEIYDRGKGRCTFTLDFIKAGEALGIDPKTTNLVVNAWSALLRDNGLEILAIEASCVDDRWRLAGTLDRIVRCTRELRFAQPDGTIIVVPAGTVLILDIKFGKCRLAHAIQVAGYRQSVPYDTDLEQRGVWPWEISDTHALIAKGDFGGDGTPVTFTLVHVDLVAGREHGGETVARAKAWGAREDIFSVAQLDVPGDGSPISATPGTLDVEGESELTGKEAAASPSTTPSPQATQSPATVNAGVAGSAVPTRPPAVEWPDVENDDVPPAKAEALAWASQPAPAPLPPLPANPAEGKTLKDAGFDLLEQAYKRLPVDDRKWITRLGSEASRASVSFHAGNSHSTRRFYIIRSLVDLANHYSPDDDVLRALCVAALHNDAPLDPRHTPGACVGSLDAAAAQRFATLCDDYVGTTV